MKLERLLELAQTATPPFQPPTDLLALLRESLSKSLSENTLTKYYPLLSEYRKELITFASAPIIKSRKKPRSIKDITQILTTEQIRDLLVISWIRQLHPQRPNEPLNYSAFIQQQLYAYFFATQLQNQLNPPVQSEFGLTVLFSAIYQPLLSRFDPDLFIQLKQAGKEAVPLHQKPTDFTPAQLTRALLLQWGLPQHFADHFQSLETSPAKIRNKETREFQGFVNLVIQLSRWCMEEKTVAFPYLQQLAQKTAAMSAQALFDYIQQALQTWPTFASALDYHPPTSPDPLAMLLKDPAVVQQKLIPYDELAAAYLGLLDNCHSPSEKEKNVMPSLEVQFADKTTGVYNHTYFQLSLQNLIAQASRYSFPISLIMLDVDAFKLLNEVHGHLVGDAILKQTAQLLKNKLRQADIICRIGADEFGIILSHTGRLHAHHVAEKIRRAIERHTFYHPTQDRTYPVTVSVAYAAFTPEISVVQKNQLLEITRRALIKAKIRGGNVCLEGQL